jgi:hypothetical protein
MSVKIVDYKARISNEGKPFFALVLQGGIEIVKSASGNSYATAKTGSMPTTFSEEVCKGLLGSDLPGRIERVETEPYEFTVPETGEVLFLHHRYEYIEQEVPVQQQDFTKVYQNSDNGVKQMAYLEDGLVRKKMPLFPMDLKGISSYSGILEIPKIYPDTI